MEKEAAIVDCGEPTVAAVSAQGVNAVYAAPVEGFLLWALSVSIVRNPERSQETTQAAYDLIDFLLDGWYGATIGLARGFMTNPLSLAYAEDDPDRYTMDQQVKLQALDSAGRLKFQKGGVWAQRWPEERQSYLREWERFKEA